MKEAILTITPNPALDISGFVRKINVNEKTYVHGEKRSPGGNAINVARILHRLQVPVLASGFLGGSIGEEVQKLLELEGVQQQFIKTEASTRINVTIANKSDHRQTRFSFAGPEIKNTEIRELMKIVSKHRGAKTLVVGGSLPPHFQVQDLNRLIQRAQQQKMDVVVDCPGLILKEIRASGLLLIKPNLDEFRIMTGSRVTTVSQVLKKAGRLLQTASYICVSSVEEGAILTSRSGSYFGRIPRVKIRSTVGAGDSMVGAMVAQLQAGNTSVGDILRWGLAAAAATLNEEGTDLARSSRVHSLYKKTIVTAL